MSRQRPRTSRPWRRWSERESPQGHWDSRLLARSSTGPLDGEPVPGTFAAEDELFGIGQVLASLGTGVFELAPAGVMGEDLAAPEREVGLDAAPLGGHRTPDQLCPPPGGQRAGPVARDPASCRPTPTPRAPTCGLRWRDGRSISSWAFRPSTRSPSDRRTRRSLICRCTSGFSTCARTKCGAPSSRRRSPTIRSWR